MTLHSDYVHRRYLDPDQRPRDVGMAVAVALQIVYGAEGVAPLVLDSETVRERIARNFLRDIEDAGYRVSFVGRPR